MISACHTRRPDHGPLNPVSRSFTDPATCRLTAKSGSQASLGNERNSTSHVPSNDSPNRPDSYAQIKKPAWLVAGRLVALLIRWFQKLNAKQVVRSAHHALSLAKVTPHRI